jgi:hypothetical protein
MLRNDYSGMALFSDDQQYRYILKRVWVTNDEPVPVFIMLNPSSANAETNDPTIKRCMGFAKHWGYSGVEIVNLFALISTNPKILLNHDYPIGPDNDMYLHGAIASATIVIAAWGTIANKTRYKNRVPNITRMAVELNQPLYCVGTTKEGDPIHPLYQPADTKPVLWNPI